MGEAFDDERLQQLIEWATPNDHQALIESHRWLTSAIGMALKARSPFDVVDFANIGASGRGCEVCHYEEDLELVVQLRGLAMGGVEDYRGFFLDFMLEYLKANLAGPVHDQNSSSQQQEELHCERFALRSHSIVMHCQYRERTTRVEIYFISVDALSGSDVVWLRLAKAQARVALMRKQTPSVLNAIRVVKYWAHSELPSDVQLSPLLLEIVVHHVAKMMDLHAAEDIGQLIRASLALLATPEQLLCFSGEAQRSIYSAPGPIVEDPADHSRNLARGVRWKEVCQLATKYDNSMETFMTSPRCYPRKSPKQDAKAGSSAMVSTLFEMGLQAQRSISRGVPGKALNPRQQVIALQQAGKAVGFFEEALAIAPSDPSPRAHVLQSRVKLRYAVALLEQQRYAKCELLLKELVKENVTELQDMPHRLLCACQLQQRLGTPTQDALAKVGLGKYLSGKEIVDPTVSFSTVATIQHQIERLPPIPPPGAPANPATSPTDPQQRGSPQTSDAPSGSPLRGSGGPGSSLPKIGTPHRGGVPPPQEDSMLSTNENELQKKISNPRVGGVTNASRATGRYHDGTPQRPNSKEKQEEVPRRWSQVSESEISDQLLSELRAEIEQAHRDMEQAQSLLNTMQSDHTNVVQKMKEEVDNNVNQAHQFRELVDPQVLNTQLMDMIQAGQLVPIEEVATEWIKLDDRMSGLSHSHRVHTAPTNKHGTRPRRSKHGSRHGSSRSKSRQLDSIQEEKHAQVDSPIPSRPQTSTSKNDIVSELTIDSWEAEVLRVS